MTFFVELPPIMERLPEGMGDNLLKAIANCYERQIPPTVHTLQRKTGQSERSMRPSVLALMNEGLIEPIASTFTDYNSGDHGRFGYKLTKAGWDKVGYKPIWME